MRSSMRSPLAGPSGSHPRHDSRTRNAKLPISSMIETLSLRNFKGFDVLDQLRFKPVTILCGTNSSGKSTILQSILLLKQTLDSQTPNQTLLLNGRLVHLGAFENVISGHDTDRVLTFEFSFDFSIYDQPSANSFPPAAIVASLAPGRPNRDAVRVRIHIGVKAIKQDAVDPQLGSLQLHSFEATFQTGMQGAFDPPVELRINHLEGDTYNIEWNDLPLLGGDRQIGSGSEVAKMNVVNILPLNIVSPESPPPHQSHYAVMAVLFYITQMIKHVFGSYSYLGPLREEPSRRYIYEDEVVEIGVKGENAPYISLAEQYSPLYDHYFYEPKSDSFEKKAYMRLDAAVRDWLEIMDIHGLSPERSREIIYVNLRTQRETQVNIADVGFGVSQVFPIVLGGLRMQKRNTLLLEQPEIHLHPNLQMLLADYFISLALSGKNVIVETHSDHMINRLVRRIVEDPTDKLKELVAIYFIKNTAGTSVYDPIIIDSNRGIMNWPIGFFDQNAIEQESIIRAGLKKRLRT